MWPYHPEASKEGNTQLGQRRRENYPNLPLFEGNRPIDDEVTAEDQAELTTSYTEHAVDFIDRNKDRPFFLFVPDAMVHVPLYVSDKFLGKSGVGLFGDVMMEVDWSVGQILDALQRNGIDENTLVIFTSDNGPWLRYGNHAGSAGPLREGKGTKLEGGYRVACLMRWPGKIPPGTACDELAATIDILPTVARLVGAKLPSDRIIDGKDIWPLMAGEAGAESPHEAFWCYWNSELQAVRDRRWKLHFPHTYSSMASRPGGRDGVPRQAEDARIGQALYDLKNDVGETTDVAAEHPNVVARLMKHAEAARAALGDSLTGRQGSEIRPPGEVDKPIGGGNKNRKNKKKRTAA
jgi:arylsulfatase A-like enzyme